MLAPSLNHSLKVNACSVIGKSSFDFRHQNCFFHEAAVFSHDRLDAWESVDVSSWHCNLSEENDVIMT